MKDLSKYKGVIVPMVTPVNDDLSIDHVAVASIMKTFTKSEVSVFLLGTTGESTSLTEVQKRNLIRIALEHKTNNISLLAGISSTCLRESIEHANEYAQLGADAVVAHLPFYYPVSPGQMIKYFTTLADEINCPLFLYNNPVTVKQSIPLEVVDELSHHKSIIGFKDSERGIYRLDKAINFWKNRNDFVFLIGWAAKSAYGLLNGCHGIVPSTGNLTPSLYKNLYDCALNKDKEGAFNYQEKTDKISAIYQKDRNISQSIPALKIIMSEYQLCKHFVLPPMYLPDNDEIINLKQQIREELSGVDI
jgi:dihydrodipicolinate synthase/N-acetylneuraminate lyase